MLAFRTLIPQYGGSSTFFILQEDGSLIIDESNVGDLLLETAPDILVGTGIVTDPFIRNPDCSTTTFTVANGVYPALQSTVDIGAPVFGFYYQFNVFQSQNYTITLVGEGGNPVEFPHVYLFNYADSPINHPGDGNEIDSSGSADGTYPAVITANLPVGTYVLECSPNTSNTYGGLEVSVCPSGVTVTGFSTFNAGATDILVPVAMNGIPTATASVDYATRDGTGIAGTNYTATSGTLTWTIGDITTQNITIAQIGNTNWLADVVLSNPVGCLIVGPTVIPFGNHTTLAATTQITAPSTFSYLAGTTQTGTAPYNVLFTETEFLIAPLSSMTFVFTVSGGTPPYAVTFPNVGPSGSPNEYTGTVSTIDGTHLQVVVNNTVSSPTATPVVGAFVITDSAIDQQQSITVSVPITDEIT